MPVSESTPYQRADRALVERGLFESRAKAREAIEAGLVSIEGRVLLKASALVAPSDRIEAAAPYPWVSRGGVKLAAALDAFGFNPQGLICLDVGASTGGFTDVLLSRGAARVYAVDVGRGQLHPRLKADPRVIAKEALDVRKLTSTDFQEPLQLITCDVSFISLKLVLPTIISLAPPMSMLVALIKPQFEVGPAFVVKGIVKNEAARERARDEIESFVQNSGCVVAGVIPSPIEGGDGNREYLIGARKMAE